METKSIWEVKDKNNNKLGHLATEDYLDIIDVINTAKNKYQVGVNDISVKWICDVQF